MSDSNAPKLDRTKPPPPGAPKDVTFPDYFETVLGNGLKVIVYKRTDFPMVTMNLVMRGGAYFDGALPGTATMTAEMLTKGTASRSATQIVEEVEYLGGSIAAGAGWDSTSAGVTILSKYCEEALAVLADVAMNPSFPEGELARVRDQRLAALMQRKSNPAALAADRFARAVFVQHPYAFPSDGTEDSVAAMTPAELAAFHGRIFSPANMFLIAVGDVEPENFAASAERLFGALTPGERLAQTAAPPPPAGGMLVHVVDRPQAVQSSIIAGHVGVARNNPDYIAVTVMNTLFGGYFGSRLNLNLREDKGYTYGAHARFEGRMQPGPFMAGAEVRNDATADAIAEMIGEVRRMVDAPIGADELASVQQYITGNFPIQIETPAQVAQRIITMELYDLGKTYYNTFNSNVMKLTPDDVSRAARHYLFPERLAIAVCGRGALLSNTLARFGAVQVFDADGTLIPNVSST